MKFVETKLKGVYIVEQDIFNDNRGSFIKTFHKGQFESLGLETNFRESYYTKSKKNVIRGMHFQVPPHDHAKLVTVISGSIIDVVLDLRKDSLTYKKYLSVELSRKNGKSIYIPKGCAHGFSAISNLAIAYYMVTTEYDYRCDQGIRYNSFGYDWTISNPIVSDRDNAHLVLNEFKTPFS